MKKVLMILILAVAGTSTYGQKAAVITKEEAGWMKISETTVSFDRERDEVMVAGNDKFKAIMLKATDAAVDIMDVTVYYENDTKQDIPVKSVLKAGDKTRKIDLEGNNLSIRKIAFVYKTVPDAKDEKAHLEIYGMK